MLNARTWSSSSCRAAWGRHRADNITVTPGRISYGHSTAIYCKLDTVNGSSSLTICPTIQTNLSDSACGSVCRTQYFRFQNKTSRLRDLLMKRWNETTTHVHNNTHVCEFARQFVLLHKLYKWCTNGVFLIRIAVAQSSSHLVCMCKVLKITWIPTNCLIIKYAWSCYFHNCWIPWGTGPHPLHGRRFSRELFWATTSGLQGGRGCSDLWSLKLFGTGIPTFHLYLLGGKRPKKTWWQFTLCRNISAVVSLTSL